MDLSYNLCLNQTLMDLFCTTRRHIPSDEARSYSPIHIKFIDQGG